MGLNANETLVYAFLYSFTQGKTGVYYGTQKYISNTLNIAMRTVERVLKNLREKGLIENYVSDDGKIKGIRTRMPAQDIEDFEEEEEIMLPKVRKTPKTSNEIEENLPYIEEKFAPIEMPGIETLFLTEKQYEKLRELVPNDVLYGYARRFDRYMLKRVGSVLPAPRSHYKLIKQWIEEDLGT
jgi:predicted DNA-binding transcriptional regulator